MFPKYRNIQNAHALHAISKAPTMPNENLAIGGDDEMSNIPLVIFRDQHQRMPSATLPEIMSLPYEKTAVKGAGDTLSMENFVTDDFQLGSAFDSII